MYALQLLFYYGWDYFEHDGSGRIVIYPTRSGAEISLKSFLIEMDEAVEDGDLMDGCSRDELRVVEITNERLPGEVLS